MLKGKKEGSMMKMLPVLLSVVTLAMLSIIYLNNMQTMEIGRASCRERVSSPV